MGACLVQRVFSLVSVRYPWQTFRAKHHLSKKTLRDLLGFGHDAEYQSWRSEHPELASVSEERLVDSYQWLVRDRFLVTAQQVREHPWLLSAPRSSLDRKLSLLGSPAVDDGVSLTLLAYPETLLQHMLRKLGASLTERLSHRFKLLRESLSLSEPEALQLFKNHPCLLTQESGRLERILKILLSCGVHREAILKDPWVFRHNEEVMQDRVSRSMRVGAPVKTWMLRCPEETFARHLELWEAKRRTLGVHVDTLDYLAERLHCSRDYVTFMGQRYPRLLSINAPKLKQVLDLLFQYGYSPEQISLFPRVLSSSVGRLQRRLDALRNLENHDSGTGQQNGCRESSLLSLYLLNATEKEFSRAYRRRLQDRKQQLLDTGAADDSSQASTNSPSQSVKSPNRAST